VQPIVIAAGGTGGHFFPAEALAATLIKRGHRVVLMTDARSGALQSDVFSGHEVHVLRGAGIAGRGLAKAARAAASLAAGILQARAILVGLDAAAIVAFGGYPSVPPILAARMLRRHPVLVLHEQNAVLGRANRFLSQWGDLLAFGFNETARVPASAKTSFVGNPVRPAIQELAAATYTPPVDTIRLLVTGGSLGARIFSDVVPAALSNLPLELRVRLHVVQQCRADDVERVTSAYAESGIHAELSPFFRDVAERIAAAHLVIARAGASTCAELAVIGRPAILVPLPTAIDDHQAANARALIGATIICQTEFSPKSLCEKLQHMLTHPAELTAAAHSIVACARPRAAEELADAVELLIARVGARA